jgi:excisionase family DNA binding protein
MNMNNTNQNAANSQNKQADGHPGRQIEESGARQAAPPPATREYLTPGELAEWLGVSLRTVGNLRARHAIPYVKLGRVVRFRRSQVEAALQAFTIARIG